MRPVADGKRMFLWCEVLVLLDNIILLEGSATILTAMFYCPGNVHVPEEVADYS